MPQTPNLSLAFLEAGQAQKHVTLNEALRLLDVVVQLAVAAVSESAPAEPADGERHLVGAAPSGAFAGHAHAIAAFQDGAWAFLAPQIGWRAWNAGEETLLVWTGSAWNEISAGGAGTGDVAGPDGGVAGGNIAVFDGTDGKAIKKDRGRIDYLGVGAAPDPTSTDTANRLIVRGSRALFDASPASETPGSGDFKVQVSKEAAGNTASWFFATNYAPRGEIGFIEDDDELRFKVFDGADWHEALSFVRATGAVKIGGAALGTAALKNTGTSGDAVPLLNQANTFSATQTFQDISPTINRQSNSVTQQPIMMFERARAANAAVVDGDSAGKLGVRARNSGATDYCDILTIRFLVDGTNIGGSGNHGGRIIFSTRGASDTNQFTDGMARLQVNNDGSIYFPGIGTTGSAANAFLNSGSSPANNLLRSTSSLAYKKDVELLDDARADEFLKSVEPIWYRSLAPADKLDDGAEMSFYSFGAEPLAEIDPRLVSWGYPAHAWEYIEHRHPRTEDVVSVLKSGVKAQKDGTYRKEDFEDRTIVSPETVTIEPKLKPDARKVPDGVNDRALIAMLVNIVKRQETRIATLEARLG